jgi:hypothetical protein
MIENMSLEGDLWRRYRRRREKGAWGKTREGGIFMNKEGRKKVLRIV